MALPNLDSRVALTITAFAHRVLLAGFVGIGLAIAGCGGSDETPPTTSESSEGTDSGDMAMNDPAMGGDPGMSDSSMQGSMDESMADESGDEFDDPSMTRTEGPGEPGSGGDFSGDPTADTSTDPEAMAAEMAAGEAAGGGEPGTDDPTLTAEMASAEGGANTPGALDETTLSAEMEGAAVNGEFGPGTDTGELGPGSGGPDGGGGGGAAKEPPADSADYLAFKIVMGLMQGKHEGLKGLVSTRGRGLTEKIRSGSLTKAEIGDLKKTFAQPRLVGTPRTIRGSRTHTLNSGGQVITLVSKKQGSAWKVSSISIRAAKKR